MTNSEIRAMFSPGQTWRTTRQETDAMRPANETILTVDHHDAHVVVMVATDGAKHHVAIPRTQVIEQRDGYLRYRTGHVEVTLEHMAA